MLVVLSLDLRGQKSKLENQQRRVSHTHQLVRTHGHFLRFSILLKSFSKVNSKSQSSSWNLACETPLPEQFPLFLNEREIGSLVALVLTLGTSVAWRMFI